MEPVFAAVDTYLPSGIAVIPFAGVCS